MMDERIKARLAKMPLFVRQEIERRDQRIKELEHKLGSHADSNVVIPAYPEVNTQGMPEFSTVRFVLDKKRAQYIEVQHYERKAVPATRIVSVRGSHGQLVVMPSAANTLLLKLGEYE